MLRGVTIIWCVILLLSVVVHAQRESRWTWTSNNRNNIDGSVDRQSDRRKYETVEDFRDRYEVNEQATRKPNAQGDDFYDNGGLDFIGPNSVGSGFNGPNSGDFGSNRPNTGDFGSNRPNSAGFNSNGINSVGSSFNGPNSGDFGSNRPNSGGFNSNGINGGGFNTNGINNGGFSSNRPNSVTGNGYNSNGFGAFPPQGLGTPNNFNYQPYGNGQFNSGFGNPNSFARPGLNNNFYPNGGFPSNYGNGQIYPGSYGPNRYPFNPLGNSPANGILVGPGGPTGIYGRPPTYAGQNQLPFNGAGPGVGPGFNNGFYNNFGGPQFGGFPNGPIPFNSKAGSGISAESDEPKGKELDKKSDE